MNTLKKINMKISTKDLFLIPNLITLFRLLLSLPIIYIFLNYNSIPNSNYFVVGIIILAFVSDITDGFVARKTKQISEMGKLLDPLADKILTAIIIFFLWKISYVPLEYLVILLLRDAVIFSGGIYLTRKTQTITPSNYFGKFTILSIGIYFLTLLLTAKGSQFSLFMMYFSAFLSISSIFVYFFRGIKILKGYGNIQ
ncbi:MAG: CDP-alcohol phosphatidyltransferase family protein [Ignavibacteriales bacterium]|nr:CDP-alcohol phosphatidyltransferase family protein [Ignavibacteriales bacterium]